MNVKPLMIAASTLAVVGYFAAIWYVWKFQGTGAELGFPSMFITIIGGTLATHLGAVLGLNRLNEKAGQPRAELGWLGTIAAWSYFGSLVLCAILWGIAGFQSDFAEPIRNLALTFPGVVAGILAVALNVTPQPQKRADA